MEIGDRVEAAEASENGARLGSTANLAVRGGNLPPRCCAAAAQLFGERLPSKSVGLAAQQNGQVAATCPFYPVARGAACASCASSATKLWAGRSGWDRVSFCHRMRTFLAHRPIV